MRRTVYVTGVGMIPFVKPGASESYDIMGAKAARLALEDAGIGYDKVQQAYAGYVYGDSCAGQRVLYDIGLTGIPFINVTNNCATGSTALFLARQAVASGAVDCVIAVGFEQMKSGALAEIWDDRPTPLGLIDALAQALTPGAEQLPLALRYFGGAGKAHMDEYGTKLETFAAIRSKASRHAANNPAALFRKPLSIEDVMSAPMLWDGVMTRPMACPPTCGAAAAILCSEGFAKKHGLSRAVKITGQAMTSDRPSTFESGDMRKIVGTDLTRAATASALEESGVDIADVDLVELHDCFAHNELISYEALGLCRAGEAEKLTMDGDNTYGGKYVVNPSGGLLSKGHPLGATGLAQCYELTHQLRGSAEARQVAGARVGLQHNLGLGSACVVTIYQSA